MREQFWFWFGYRPGFGTVARPPLRGRKRPNENPGPGGPGFSL